MRQHKEPLFSITKKDFKLDFFSGRGPGGQNRNKNQNCVRLQHPDSGVQVTGQSHKSRQQNIKQAFQSLVEHPRFKLWHARRMNEVVTGETIKQRVEAAMDPKNLLI